MNENIRPAGKPCRGIIVADANDLERLSTLYLLSAPCGHRFDSPLLRLKKEENRTTGSYLDLLVVLAQHGYRIIIPEMVSKETAWVLANGRDICAAFNNQKDQFSTQGNARRFCMNASPAVKPLLRYDNIEISKAKEDTLYTRVIQEFYEAMSNPAAIARLQKEYSGLKNMGEDHCIDVIIEEINRQREAHERIPIFFLSADAGARQKLDKRLEYVSDVPPVNVLAANGLMIALEKDKIGETNALMQLGLQGKGMDHWEHIKKSCDKPHKINKTTEYYGNGGKNNNKNYHKDYYDAPLGRYNTNEFPFAASVRGLAAELKGSPTTPLTPLERVQQSSPVNGGVGGSTR